MWTFGGAVTDSITHTALPSAMYAASKVTLTTIWAYPTTLTATRVLVSSGTSGVAIDTTTTSLRLTLVAATTPGVWTFPAGLAINQMSFIAVLSSQNAAGGTAAVRAWAGTDSAGPSERSVTQATAPVGAWTSSGTGLASGNNSGGSLAFQGDLGGVVACVEDKSSTTDSLMGVQTQGTILQTEADSVFNRMVMPLWRGDLQAVAGEGRGVFEVATSTEYGFAFAASYDRGTPTNGAWAIYGNNVRSRGTVTGAVANLQRWLPHWSIEENRHNKMTVRNGRRSFAVLM